MFKLYILFSGNMLCGIKCSMCNHCEAFFHESSVCHLARSKGLREALEGSFAQMSVFVEEAKWHGHPAMNESSNGEHKVHVFRQSD